jgi:hypothetical protein
VEFAVRAQPHIKPVGQPQDNGALGARSDRVPIIDFFPLVQTLGLFGLVTKDGDISLDLDRSEPQVLFLGIKERGTREYNEYKEGKGWIKRGFHSIPEETYWTVTRFWRHCVSFRVLSA